MNLWTARYNYSGEDRYDITAKSGDRVFAPTWQLVQSIKNSSITWDEYIVQYTELMRSSYRHNKQYWINLLQQSELTLVCFCNNSDYCHRTLLADMFVKVGCINNISIIYHGEKKICHPEKDGILQLNIF